LKDHIRTFATVFPNVVAVRGFAGYGFYMLGSMQPVALDPVNAAAVLERPGVLEDVSGAFDSPPMATTVEGWVAEIQKQTWLVGGDTVRAYAGPGPLITDDNPRPEYFLLRDLSGDTGG
jgi:hypothetical protein